jgi:uncharacterized membrane protein YphA (DoxX/SURF4 family)
MPAVIADRNTRAIVGLRLSVGILFLFFGEYKVFGTRFVLGGGFESWIHRFLAEHAVYPFMVSVLRDFVLAHSTPIALLVACGELAIGLSLTVGLWTRVASVCGFAYMLALLFASNYPGADVAPWQYLGAALDHLVLVFCFAALAIGDPDRSMSLSAYLQGRRQPPGRNTRVV